MQVKNIIKLLEKCDPEALAMVATTSDEGDVQMVEADVQVDLRTGDIEIVPAN